MGYSQIKGITLEIGGDTTQLSRALSSVNRDLRTTQSDLNSVNKALKLDPTNVNLLKDKHDLLGKAITDTRSKLDMLKEAYRQGLSNPNIGQDEMDSLQREIDLTESSLNNLTSEYNNFGQNATQQTEQVVQNTKTLSQTLDETGEKFKNVGDKLQSVGGTLTKTITTPIIGAGTASAKLATDFETAMAKVSTIADDSVPIEDMRKQILQLSNDTGIAASDIAEDVYSAISAGQETGDAIAFVAKSAKLAKSGFAESAESMDLMTTILNAYGLSADEATSVSDKLIQTQNKGKTTVAELASSMGRVIPTAKAANVNLSNVTAAMAKMTANGTSTAESSTKLNALLNEMSKSSTSLAKAIKEQTGKSFGELMSDGYSLTDVLAEVQKYADKTGVAFGDVFSSTEAKAAAQVLSDTTNKLGDFNATVKEMDEASGATDAAFEKVSGTTAASLNKSLNELKNLGIEIGTTILPTITEVAKELGDGIKKVSDWFGNLDESQQQFIIKAVTLAATVGPVLTIFGKMSNGIGSIIQLGGKLSGFLGNLGSTTATVSQASSTLTTVSSTASQAGQGLSSAGQSMGVLSQNALGFVAAGAGIALAAAGMYILAQAAIEIAEAGAPAGVAMAGMVVAIAALAAVFALLGKQLTAGAIGIGVFGVAVLAIGAGIGIASAGIALLASQFPTMSEYGGEAAKALLQIGGAIVSMSASALTATPGLLALGVSAGTLALALAASDLALVTFAGTMTLAAGGVGILDLAMLGLYESVKGVAKQSKKAADSMQYIQNSVDVIDAGVKGLKDVVSNGLDSIVDAFSNHSTKPVDTWTNSLSNLQTVTTTKMSDVEIAIKSSLQRIQKAFSSTNLSLSHNIQLPHFSMDGTFNAKSGTVPTVDVNWYKTGGIFNSPSIIGVGEAGSEAVVPLDKLQTMIDNSTGGASVVAMMESMLSIMKQYLPQRGNVVLDSGALVGELTPALDAELGQRAERRSRQS